MNNHCPECGQTLGTGQALPRIKRWLVRKLAETPEGLSRRDVTIACAARDRSLLSQAIAEALHDRLIYMRENRLASASSYGLNERICVPARIAVATAPWFGNCEPCDRELGYPKPELVGRLLSDEPCNGKWLCVEHLKTKLLAP